MKKNWLSGLVFAVAMLMCSVSWAAPEPIVMPVTWIEVAMVTGTGLMVGNVAVAAQNRPNNDGIGAGSSGILAMASDYGGDSDRTMPCMASCQSEKATDNTTAYLEMPFEVGWQS